MATQGRYAITPRGFLVHRYDAMKNRVLRAKLPLYAGLDLMSAGDFTDWGLRNETFHRMYCEWMASGRKRGLTPTVNRIDPSRGYTLDNVEWMSLSDNCRLAGFSRKKKS